MLSYSPQLTVLVPLPLLEIRNVFLEPIPAPIKVVLDDFTENPTCQHGPTVLFKRINDNGKLLDKFYACTASRDGKCSFQNVSLESSLKKTPKNNNSSGSTQTRKNQSNVVVSKEPTRFLQPLSIDKSNAQYFFADSALNCVENIFLQLGITKVLCIGAPRLHEHLLQKTTIESLLLDIDNRFHGFYSNKHFLHYNMFNHYFFRGRDDEEMFENFLKNPGFSDRICIFTDPPFGCRTELLANTIQRLNQLYNRINSFVQQILPTFWVFPYFMEQYIRQEMPSMEMSDYQVNYTNHKKFRDDSKSQKNGSPVRIFTNVPLSMITLPFEEGYKFCDKCDKSVFNKNVHCTMCRTCSSKNGATYKHCTKCNFCVKSNYKHCNMCGRCAQKEGHDCKLYKKMVTCRICSLKGHAEKMCTFWKRYKHTQIFHVGCAVCGNKTHILRDCAERKRLTNEVYFLGQCQNDLNVKKMESVTQMLVE